MKKLLEKIIVSVFFVFSSCNFVIPEDSKVYIVGVSSNYSASLYLNSTCRDVEEFCSYYKKILDVKNIDNKLFLMIDKSDGNWSGRNWNVSNNYTDKTSKYAPSIENVRNLLLSFVDGTADYDKLDSNDLLVFYYSGHGVAPKNGKYSEDSVGAFILPDYATDDYEYLYNRDLADLLMKLPCQVVLICDSCYSGHFAGLIGENAEAMGDSSYNIGTTDEYKTDFSTIANLSNVSGIFSSPAAEQSLSDEIDESGEGTILEFCGESHSLFTGFMLIRALGWTHCDERFVTLPSARDNSQGIFTSYNMDVDVFGRPMNEEDMLSLTLSTQDMIKVFGTFNKYNESQRTVISTGLTSKLILW